MLQLSQDFGAIVFREIDKTRSAFYVQLDGETIPAFLCKCKIATGQQPLIEYSFDCPIDIHATRARARARAGEDTP
jgi:hypothetical protein